MESQKQNKQFDALAQIVEQNTPKPTQSPATDGFDEMSPGTTAPFQPSILPEYQQLSAMNPDMVGWLQIENTQVNYPLMQTPDRPDYYLYRDFYGQHSNHGFLYAREICDVDAPSDNITIYGHNMKDGSMFGDLMNYRDREFWLTHPTVRFSTLKAHHNYVIFAVFITTANEGQGFEYHRFVDTGSEEKYNNYVDRCKTLSLYDTGVTPIYGDKLITLSTCEYTHDNGRLVVVAKQVS